MVIGRASSTWRSSGGMRGILGVGHEGRKQKGERGAAREGHTPFMPTRDACYRCYRRAFFAAFFGAAFLAPPFLAAAFFAGAAFLAPPFLAGAAFLAPPFFAGAAFFEAPF